MTPQSASFWGGGENAFFTDEIRYIWLDSLCQEKNHIHNDTAVYATTW